MSDITLQESTEKDSDEYDNKFNEFIFDAFKKTGNRISKDDPVLSMLLLHEAIQKKQTDTLNANFIALSEGFKHVLSSLEEENLQRFRKIVETCGDLDKEIKDSIDSGKSELKNLSNQIQSDLAQHTLNLFAGIKTDYEKVSSGYQKQIDSLAKTAKPFSTTKAMAICVICTLFVTAGLSGASWYVAKSQKEQDLRIYSEAYTDMRDLTEKTINRLPKAQQETARTELKILERGGK